MNEPDDRMRADRRVWPLVVGALIVVGLLIGGGIARVRNDPNPPTPPASVTPTTSPSTPPLALAQLDGPYRVTLIVRGARNLASLAGIDQPVPGDRRETVWRFFPTCSADAEPCPASWEGHRPPVFPSGDRWAGTIAGRAPCRNGGRVQAPIVLDLRPRSGVTIGGHRVVGSFVGTYSVTFRCPGFASAHGTVEVSGFRP